MKRGGGRRGRKKPAAKRVAAKAAKPRKAVAKSAAGKPTKAAKPTLLSGGNPQIAKADGDAPCRPTSRPCRAAGGVRQVEERFLTFGVVS